MHLLYVLFITLFLIFAGLGASNRPSVSSIVGQITCQVPYLQRHLSEVSLHHVRNVTIFRFYLFSIFLKWQPCHFPVMAFCLVVLIFLDVFQ